MGRRSRVDRGRRIAWLVASALPLLANQYDDDVGNDHQYLPYCHRTEQHATNFLNSELEGHTSTCRRRNGWAGEEMTAANGEDDKYSLFEEEDDDLFEPSTRRLFDQGRYSSGPWRRKPSRHQRSSLSLPASWIISNSHARGGISMLLPWWNRESGNSQNQFDWMNRYSFPLKRTWTSSSSKASITNPSTSTHAISMIERMAPTSLPSRLLSMHDEKEKDVETAAPLASTTMENVRLARTPSTEQQPPREAMEVRIESSASARLDRNESPPLLHTTTTSPSLAEASSSASVPSQAPEAQESEDPPPTVTLDPVVVDYASYSAGGLILEKSVGFKGTSNLLNSDPDRYALVPCQEPIKYVVIGLSEDILVKQIVLTNWERYASSFHQFRVFGSTTAAAADHWSELGNFYARPGPAAGPQTFDLPSPTWARYLKFRFLTHYGDEHYCTLSQIRVHGSTVLQGFHEEWNQEGQQEDLVPPVVPAVSDHEQGSVMNHQVEHEPVYVPADAAPSSPEKTNQEELPKYNSADCISLASTNGTVESTEDGAVVNGEAILPNEDCGARNDLVCWSDEGFQQMMRSFGSTSDSSLYRLGPRTSSSSCVAAERPVSSCKTGETASVFYRVSTLQSSDKRRPADSGRGIIANASAMMVRLCESPAVSHVRDMIDSSWGLEIGLHHLLRGCRLSMQQKVDELTEKQQTSECEGTESTPGRESHGDATVRLGCDTDQHSAGVDSTNDQADEGMDLALTQLVKKVPSAKCLDGLRFAPSPTAKPRSAGNTPFQGNTPGSLSMEPLFKKLTDEIRVLQGTIAAQDVFVKDALACYQRIVADLLVELEKGRLEQLERLERLERLVLDQSKDAPISSALCLVQVSTFAALFLGVATFLAFLCRGVRKVPGDESGGSPDDCADSDASSDFEQAS